ncbi:MAG: ABC transporter ATP-binding protein [Desulfobacterales bacterium]|nr:ABC transporter ATP-binding protein [Desulfobacterales bacterium]MDD4072608.1 ABC transporter ATP-binding protein [Desulfobacterales bacterium]MDD4392358.1 ABC transporter ATP-binding protein [Desulfobacterales bacterium]
MKPILEVKKLTMDFGGLRALDHLDLDINKGEIIALIGPNGAGKTTFFNCITGMYIPTRGDILISPPGKQTQRINGLKPNKITEKGMARTFQNIRLFPTMTVLENVMVGRHCRARAGIIGAIFKGPSTRLEEQNIVDISYHMIERVGLSSFVNEQAKNLPYGAQRRLEIARAMATDPFLILLDEPAAGMNPLETRELVELITSIRETEGFTILLIEHDMKLVMSLSDRIFVMDYGRKIAQGTPEEIRNNPQVIKAYLGDEIYA